MEFDIQVPVFYNHTIDTSILPYGPELYSIRTVDNHFECSRLIAGFEGSTTIVYRSGIGMFSYESHNSMHGASGTTKIELVSFTQDGETVSTTPLQRDALLLHATSVSVKPAGMVQFPHIHITHGSKKFNLLGRSGMQMSHGGTMRYGQNRKR